MAAPAAEDVVGTDAEVFGILRNYYSDVEIFSDETITLAIVKAREDLPGPPENLGTDTLRRQSSRYLIGLKTLKTGPLSDPALPFLAPFPNDANLLIMLQINRIDLKQTELQLARELFGGIGNSGLTNKFKAMSIVSTIATAIFQLMMYSSEVMQVPAVQEPQPGPEKDCQVWERMRNYFFSASLQGSHSFTHYAPLNVGFQNSDADAESQVRDGIWGFCDCKKTKCMQRWDYTSEQLQAFKQAHLKKDEKYGKIIRYHKSNLALLGNETTITNWDVSRYGTAFMYWRLRVQDRQWRGFCEEQWPGQVMAPDGSSPFAELPTDGGFGHEYITELTKPGGILATPNVVAAMKPRIIAEFLVKLRNCVIHFGPGMSDEYYGKIIKVFDLILASPFLRAPHVVDDRLHDFLDEIIHRYEDLKNAVVAAGAAGGDEIEALLYPTARLDKLVSARWQKMFTMTPEIQRQMETGGLKISVSRNASSRSPKCTPFILFALRDNIPKNIKVHVGNARLFQGERTDPVELGIFPNPRIDEAIAGRLVRHWPLLLDDPEMAPNDSNPWEYPFVLFFDFSEQKWFVERSPRTNHAAFRYLPHIQQPQSEFTIGQLQTGVFVETPNHHGGPELDGTAAPVTDTPLRYFPKRLLGVTFDGLEPLPQAPSEAAAARDMEEREPEEAAGEAIPPLPLAAANGHDNEAEVGGEDVDIPLGGRFVPNERIELVVGTRITCGRHVIIVTQAE